MRQLTAAVVGLNMGNGHASAYDKLPEFQLAALCDINEAKAKEMSQRYGDVPYYTDYAEMLAAVKPDVVSVATPNKLHCEMVVQAAESGVKGIYCEKPIAMNMREAKAMRDKCASRGIPLVIGHQRRVSAPYMTMKKAIDDGLIGEVYLIRGICAGDFLSDGTHTIDSLLYLNGDCEFLWVLGQVYRGQLNDDFMGKRFGHNTERGAISCIQLSNGVRCETVSGNQMLMHGRWYQDIEVFGSKGRLWRNNDQSDPPVKINTKGEWAELPLISMEFSDSGLFCAHRMHHNTIINGAPHPMSMENAMRGFEIVMSIYESARLNARITPPLTQEEFPLDLIIQERGDF